MTQKEQKIDEKKAILNRLRRIEGQLRGIQKMITEDKPCNDILVQLAAAKKALNQACMKILMHYLKDCLKQELRSQDITLNDETIDKILSFMLEICTNIDTKDIIINE